MLRDLIPWRKTSQRETMPARPHGPGGLPSLREEMNRLFDEVARDFWMTPAETWGEALSGFMPKVDVKETDEALTVSAELPGMKQEELDLELSGDTLVIKGEKHEQQEEKEGQYQRMERRYGSFMRAIPLSAEVDREKVTAEFADGVLKVHMPKTEEGRRQHRRIEVKGGS